MQALEGGSGAEFFQVSILPTGYTVGCVYDFQNLAVIAFASETELVNADYDTVAGTLAGTPAGDAVTTVSEGGWLLRCAYDVLQAWVSA